MRHKKTFSRKGMLSQYPNRTYVESGRTFKEREKLWSQGSGNGSGAPPPPTPPSPSCEFISLGNFGISGDVHIVYDPVNNSATSVLLKSAFDMHAILANTVVGTAPHNLTGNIHGFNGTCSKYANIVTGFLRLTSSGLPNFTPNVYVKLTVDTVAPDIFFHSYYVSDQSNTSVFQYCQPIGGCSVSADIDLWDCTTIGGMGQVYEITYNQQTSTWTDQFLFDLDPGISVAGDMVYRDSDQTIFIMCVNANTGYGGVRHYTYNGTLLNEIWGTVLGGVGSWTMYCYDGEIYFLNTIDEIWRVDENPFAIVLVAQNPGFITTGGDGATDSACCNPTSWTNPCTDPTSTFNTIPYGYKDEWYHDPINPDMTYINPLTIPSGNPWGLPPPPYPAATTPQPNWLPAGAPITQTEMETWITASPCSFGVCPPWGPWVNFYPTLLNPISPSSQPSHMLMVNRTAHFDYENQATLCEWCVDWQAGGAFDNRVLSWPLWIQNGWTTTAEAEDMCDCCPATDPGIAAWPFPPQNGAVVAEWVSG
jgi:hypothetical protein